jgi:hypothetical protein
MAKDDERISLAPLGPAEAVKPLLAIDPQDQPQEAERCPKLDQFGQRCILPKGHFGPCQFVQSK